MKRTIQTIIVSIFVVLITASFAFAANAVGGADNFPYFNLGCLIMGGLTIVSIKHRYSNMYMSEAIGSFALYAVLVSLFTVPAIETIKNIVS